MFELRQKSRRVMDYAIEFRTLATDSGWNSPAIKGAFANGLNEDIKDQLAPHEIPEEFEDLVKMAVRIDTRLRERETERRRAARRTSEHQEGAIDSSEASSSEKVKADQTLEPAPDEFPDLEKVPQCYHDLREVFSKTKAMSLPPHRPWDCPIDLLPGAPIPKAQTVRHLWAREEGHGGIHQDFHFSLASFVPPHQRPELVSSSWRKRTVR
ncbi:hypothetical protein L3Q82_016511 [Scortum barcoo]|uniref:Uncharacterized protein n=1 Tax=Scortum barcoo TaxID=214431 RepID=A0ACB8X7C2_9TELE|nr:hypothetical protein L3Q82_016511 [Scortum barcoo]